MTSIVYVQAAEGHRRYSNEQLARTLGYASVIEPVSWRIWLKLVRAQRVLFSTLDDTLIFALLVALARMLMGRQTVGLLYRAKALSSPANLVQRLRCVLHALLAHLPGARILSILPLDITPALKPFANGGVCDPQLWDMYKAGRIAQPVTTPLSEQLRTRAAGRPVVCLPGGLNRIKGFVFMCQMLKSHPELHERFQFAAVGPVDAASLSMAHAFADAGGFLVNRFVTDEEFESLYDVSDAVWACYAPDYDQASGVFGRALQFGVLPVVRAGSLLDRLARSLKVDVIALPFEASDEAARVLVSQLEASQRQARSPAQSDALQDDGQPKDGQHSQASLDPRTALIARWHDEFVAAVHGKSAR